MLKSIRKALPVLLISISAVAVLFWKLDAPALPIFDEVYHLASAQRYLNGRFFQENHPPLGKLLIALGEKTLNINESDTGYLESDKFEGEPPEMKYLGYRIVPAFFAYLAVLSIYGILTTLGASAGLAALGSLMLLLDNAFLVHSRAAMLDGILLGLMGMLLWVLVRIWKRGATYFNILLTGLLFGMVISVKHTGWITLIPLALMIGNLLVELGIKKSLKFSFALVGVAIMTYVFVWQLHYYVAYRVVGENNYQISETTAKVLKGEKNRIMATPWLLADAWAFSENYNKGVPTLDFCKADEVGSPWYYWFFGGRAINFRWEKVTDGVSKYLSLVPNPTTWMFVLIVVMATSARTFTDIIDKRKRWIQIGTVGLTLYWAYILSVSLIPRVMYLYHYLPALYFGILILILELKKFEVRVQKLIVVMILTALFAGFWYMKPFTYFQPMTIHEVEMRSLLPIWGIKTVN